MDDLTPLPTAPHGDGRAMTLPQGWDPVEEPMYVTALAQTEKAFTAGTPGVKHAVEHLVDYYDPAGRYSGATFLEVDSHDDFAVTAADLWAVSTLSMNVPADAGRALMDPGALRTIVNGTLRHLPPTLTLSDAEPRHLSLMWDLYTAIRTMLPALGERATNQWVLSSKLCARKRPLLFPVRDARVCSYLADGSSLGSRTGQLGAFQRDIQVLRYLSTHDAVRGWVGEARRRVLEQHPAWSVDWADLRVLDVVLWMQSART